MFAISASMRWDSRLLRHGSRQTGRVEREAVRPYLLDGAAKLLRASRIDRFVAPPHQLFTPSQQTRAREEEAAPETFATLPGRPGHAKLVPTVPPREEACS